jgi:hypothetical protein
MPAVTCLTDDLVDRAAAVRLRIIKTVPAVRGRALLVLLVRLEA